MFAGDVVLAYGAGYDSANGSPLVRALQRRLAAAGDRPGPIDGRYGPLTEQAVRRFQAAHGLVTDGIAGPITLGALTSSTPVLYPGAGYGMPRGSAPVRTLQRRLASLGMSPGPVDGLYGPLTTLAVERFQRSHQLQVDGIVGPRTGQALRKVARVRRTRRPVSHHRVRIRRTAPAPRVAPRVTRAVHRHEVPALPLTFVLIAIGVLGIGMAAASYKQTRAKIRRAQWSAQLEAMTEASSLPPEPRSAPSDRVPVGSAGREDREA